MRLWNQVGQILAGGRCGFEQYNAVNQ